MGTDAAAERRVKLIEQKNLHPPARIVHMDNVDDEDTICGFTENGYVLTKSGRRVDPNLVERIA